MPTKKAGITFFGVLVKRRQVFGSKRQDVKKVFCCFSGVCVLSLYFYTEAALIIFNYMLTILLLKKIKNTVKKFLLTIFLKSPEVFPSRAAMYL